jgi:hypothetical protein
MFLWPHFLLFLLKTDKVTQVPIGWVSYEHQNTWFFN